MTIGISLSAHEVNSLAQARTGTGKTLAFLIPVLQNIINYDPKLEDRGYRQVRTSPDDIRAIIVSPTRELAEQIGVEAKKLTRNTGVVVQTAVGGTQKAFGLRLIKSQGCHVLVGTPGRLKDILSDPFSQVRAPELSAFVLDEADRLLDDGFAPDIEAIQQLLPDRSQVDRQTLLFSATIPQEVMQMVRRTAKRGFQFLRTVQEGEQQTHERVPQKQVIIQGLENQIPALVELCKREIARKDSRPFKAIVYFNATADVTLAAATLRNLRNPGESMHNAHPLAPARIIEMHARLTQQERTIAAESFRRADSAIMVSSDVTARGMDFPNVTHVIQMGVPQTRDFYIHRIGRTGRSGKEGEGWIFLTAVEAREASKRLYDLPIEQDHSLKTAKVDMAKDAQLPKDVATTLTQTIDASRLVNNSLKSASYLASLGVMQWAPRGYLVESVNRRARYFWGLESPPSVPPALAGRLQLIDIPGIELGESRKPRFEDGRGGSSGESRRSRFEDGRGGSFGARGSSRDRFPSARSDQGGFGSDRSGPGNRFGQRGRTGGFDPARRYDRTERSGGFEQYQRRERGGLGAF